MVSTHAIHTVTTSISEDLTLGVSIVADTAGTEMAVAHGIMDVTSVTEEVHVAEPSEECVTVLAVLSDIAEEV